jgi:multiple sugar transport system substrate-binding protein
VAYADWLTTPEAIEAGRNAETGAVSFPTQIPDPSDYVEEVVPEGLFVDDKAAGEEIIAAQEQVIGKFELGPNYDAWFPELQDQWGKAVAGEITLEEALTAVQEFVASDLDSKGISYTVAE